MKDRSLPRDIQPRSRIVVLVIQMFATFPLMVGFLIFVVDGAHAIGALYLMLKAILFRTCVLAQDLSSSDDALFVGLHRLLHLGAAEDGPREWIEPVHVEPRLAIADVNIGMFGAAAEIDHTKPHMRRFRFSRVNRRSMTFTEVMESRNRQRGIM